MQEMKLGLVETRFADIVWENAPLSSGELVKKCESILKWKKSTTYTVLKKLCEKGIFQNKEGVVEVLISRNDFFAMQSEKFVEQTFNGSLPAFIAAFTSNNRLSQKEINEIKKMIEKFEDK